MGHKISCLGLVLLVIHLRESLKDVGQHLQRRLPACLMLVV